MKKIISSILLFVLVFGLSGCTQNKELTIAKTYEQTPSDLIEEYTENEEAVKLETLAEETTDEVPEEDMEPIIMEADWSEYFGGINGAAVIYDPKNNCYQIFDQERALTRCSPCSTFKIISSLVALEYGIIDPDDSVRAWSGETFWNEEWNRDINFSDAFHASCVWYFREIINAIGKDRIQEELNRLSYGNCDISDWEGKLNTNNSNPALTGFWLESSLLISPKEQVEVMERIFGEHTDYSEGTLDQLKDVMRLMDSEHTDISIYGKTGMGKANGVVVDAWYTGFADLDGRRAYFCVYLGETDAQGVSSAGAREIAVRIISDLEN